MKKYYKPKPINITKLKSYLQDADKKTIQEISEVAVLNTTVLSVTTFTNIELALKIILLVVSIAYTIDKWWKHKKK
jgi:hypothetical protein